MKKKGPDQKMFQQLVSRPENSEKSEKKSD